MPDFSHALAGNFNICNRGPVYVSVFNYFCSYYLYTYVTGLILSNKYVQCISRLIFYFQIFRKKVPKSLPDEPLETKFFFSFLHADLFNIGNYSILLCTLCIPKVCVH